MVRGFYLSLDKQFLSPDKVAFWKLNNGLIARAGWISPAKPKVAYHGVWLDSATTDDAASATSDADGGAVVTTMKIDKLPVGFISSKTARKWIMADSRKHATPGGALHQWETVALTDQSVTINGVEFFETTEGWWMRGLDGTKTEPGPAPEGLGADEKWVDVNLKRQTLVAFIGDKAVFATMVSSGRNQHETPPGTFRIREKHVATTMDGDAEIASDGPYSIQDVPWVEYFNAGYALHGAFWHEEFGHVKSHGCVNLSPIDAKALFMWTEPQLPDGWHGVSATKEKPGSRVIVHY
jgi:lipoprotein-anchoring transpeptidase ErfK/SrfK